jgi:hypothetical protein
MQNFRMQTISRQVKGGFCDQRANSVLFARLGFTVTAEE